MYSGHIYSVIKRKAKRELSANRARKGGHLKEFRFYGIISMPFITILYFLSDRLYICCSRLSFVYRK